MGGTTFAVLTCSDASAADPAMDAAGPALVELGENAGWQCIGREVSPSDRSRISECLIDFTDRRGATLVFTTGGTGLGPTDVTPEATMDVATRAVPGIAEAIREGSAQFTKKAMLSRAVAAQRGASLIVNLPGSESSAREAFGLVVDVIPAAVRMMRGEGKCKIE